MKEIEKEKGHKEEKGDEEEEERPKSEWEGQRAVKKRKREGMWLSGGENPFKNVLVKFLRGPQ